MHLEQVEEHAEGPCDEVNDDAEGIGAAQDEIQRECEEHGVEEDIELAHLLHEALSAGVVLLEGVGLDCRGVEGQSYLLAGLCVLVLGTYALSGLFLVGR